MASADQEDITVTNWHFSRFFHFYFTNLHSLFLFKILSYQQTHTCCYQFCLFILFQIIKKTKNTVYRSLNTTKEHYKYNRQPVYKCTAMNYRLSNCPAKQQDQRPPLRLESQHNRSSMSSPSTGGKGPNNQWAHAEYIENPVNK